MFFIETTPPVTKINRRFGVGVRVSAERQNAIIVFEAVYGNPGNESNQNLLSGH
jgi:hypothetical protein